MNNQNWFLDMCILIYYAEDNPNSEKSRRALNFVNNKKDSKFMLCHYILDINLPKWIKRKKMVIEEAKKKINNHSYIVGSSEEGKILLKQDKNECEKLFIEYLAFKDGDKQLFFDFLEKNKRITEERLKHFIKNLLDKKVIPIAEIDFELKSSLFTYLACNDSDARTIASAVQEHNKEPLMIITSDREHWKKELLDDAIAIHPTLRKKYPKIPEIKYLQEL